MNVVLLLKKYSIWKIRKITLVTKIKNCVTGITKRLKQDWSRLRAVPAPAKGTPSPGWGQLGRGNDVRVKYVSINSGLGGDRL